MRVRMCGCGCVCVLLAGEVLKVREHRTFVRKSDESLPALEAFRGRSVAVSTMAMVAGREPADGEHAHQKRAAVVRGREAVGHSPARQTLQVGGGRGATRFCAAACARILGPAVPARESPESEGTRSEHSRALVLVPMATFVGVARIYERSVS